MQVFMQKIFFRSEEIIREKENSRLPDRVRDTWSGSLFWLLCICRKFLQISNLYTGQELLHDLLCIVAFHRRVVHDIHIGRSSFRIVVVGGERGQVDALGAGGFYEKGFRFRGVQLHEKMYAGFFTGDSNILGQSAVLYSGQKGITFGVIIISQPVDMFLEVSFPDKTGQCILFEIGHCAGIKGEFL